jgi:hypothetical protein
MPIFDITKPIEKAADLASLLEAELAEVREVCDAIPGGRTRLSEFLGWRPAEISRALNTPGYQPDGRYLAGMRVFVIEARRQLGPSKKKPRVTNYASELLAKTP